MWRKSLPQRLHSHMKWQRNPMTMGEAEVRNPWNLCRRQHAPCTIVGRQNAIYRRGIFPTRAMPNLLSWRANNMVSTPTNNTQEVLDHPLLFVAWHACETCSLDGALIVESHNNPGDHLLLLPNNKHWKTKSTIWESAQSILSNKGSMTSHCLTQEGLGKGSRFLSIYLYFVADMPF